MERLFSRQRDVYLLIVLTTVSFTAIVQLPSDQLFRKGYYYLNVDGDKAIQYLSQAIERDSSRSKYYYFRGIAKFKNGDYDESLSDFSRSVDLDTSLYISYMYQGLAFRNLGRFEMAENLINQYINSNGADSSGYVYLVRGKTRMEAGDLEGALEDFSHLTEKYPEKEQNHYYRLMALEEKGGSEKCIDGGKSPG